MKSKTGIWWVFVFFPIFVAAQPDCSIFLEEELPLCKYVDFRLTVPDAEHQIYLWSPGGELTHTILTSIEENTVFSVRVIDTIAMDTCTADTLITVHPGITIDIEQLQLTCSNSNNNNGNTAQLRALASGAFDPDEYRYIWQVSPIQIAPGDSTLAIGLRAFQNYTIEVVDNFGCIETATFRTDAFDNPEMEIFTIPEKENDRTTAYLQNPFVEFSFENLSSDSISISNYFWDFGDGTETSDQSNPRHPYLEEDQYTAILTVVNPQGCDTIYAHEVEIKPVDLVVSNLVTPDDNNNINDALIAYERTESETGGSLEPIPINKYYLANSLVVLNRWGKVVYKKDNYENDWKCDNLSEGVYYYILECVGFKQTDVFKGSFTLLRL